MTSEVTSNTLSMNNINSIEITVTMNNESEVNQLPLSISCLIREKSIMVDKSDTKIGIIKSSDKNLDELEENICIICYDRKINCRFLECRHEIFCMNCSIRLDICPICRGLISHRVFNSFE